MQLDLSLVGQALVAEEEAWTADQMQLYAVAIGAGMDDPADELAFTTENSLDTRQLGVPTYASLLGGRVPPVGDVDLKTFLHAGQGVILHRPMPTSGRVRPTYTVVGVDEKAQRRVCPDPHGLARRRGRRTHRREHL